MTDFLLHIQIFDQQSIHHVWIRDSACVKDFIKDIEKAWNLSPTAFTHFFYHLESHRILDAESTFRNNEVLSGDHCILV